MRKDSEKFKVMLKYYLGKLGLKDLKKISVLDVACGRCNEAEVLLELFGKVKGIDSNSKKIKRVKRKGLRKFGFKVGDASNLSNIFNEEFNLVLVRHSNIFGNDWTKIYRECERVTKKEGFLISTFYTKKEYLKGKSLIERAGYEVEFLGENKFYLNKFGFDRYFVVGRKIKRSWFKRLFGF